MGSGREVVALRKDGREFPAEIALGPTESGECGVAVVRDITASLATRDELESALAEVERLKGRLQSEAEYLQQEVQSEHNFEDLLPEAAYAAGRALEGVLLGRLYVR